MNKFLWTGLGLFLFGIWIFGFSLWKQTHFEEISSLSVHRFSEYFPFASLSPPLPTPSILAFAEKKSEIILYSNLSCEYCHEFSAEVLLPFLKKNTSFRISVLPFMLSQKNDEINTALLLWCSQKSSSSLESLETLLSYSNQTNWKEWRDAQPNAEHLKTCMNDPKSLEEIQELNTQARAKGVIGTPTVFIDGQKFEGSLSEESFLTILSSLPKEK